MPSPRSTLFPYTTLFRSHHHVAGGKDLKAGGTHSGCAHHMLANKEVRISSGNKRSEERFSRNAEPEIYTLSLHDALPISPPCSRWKGPQGRRHAQRVRSPHAGQ